MLGADVVVAELQRFAQGQLKDLLGARRERDVPAAGLLALADDLLDLLAHGVERDAEAFQRLRGDALTLVDQAQQDVLGPDVVVVEHARFFLRQHDHTSGPVGEPLEHVTRSSLSRSLDASWAACCFPTGVACREAIRTHLGEDDSRDSTRPCAALFPEQP
ncbi:hypothetical protein GCM10025883_04550 [Mobilicoccus caccae]|uniref:Uncharacterized protein n=1 Tax=Mobilicoccus caccae TaxID=1859295 RepID=A0ABQ6IKJ0_9MICO|nr:hypothetical protein GCM10025883_04550 [Mobilicoccus caccae]